VPLRQHLRDDHRGRGAVLPGFGRITERLPMCGPVAATSNAESDPDEHCDAGDWNTHTDANALYGRPMLGNALCDRTAVFDRLRRQQSVHR